MSAFLSGINEELRGREMAGRVSETTTRGLDWLAVAIGNLGGPGPAARSLNVSRQTIYAWLSDGLAGVAFEKICLISSKGDVPLEYLARRLGPKSEDQESSGGGGGGTNGSRNKQSS